MLTRKMLPQAESDLKQKADEKDGTQGELDDLLMVFGDLEEKVNKYKVVPLFSHISS